MDNPSPTPRRYRSSASNSSPPTQVRTNVLGSLIQRLSNLAHVTLETCRAVHDNLTKLTIFFDDDGQNGIQDQFRQLHGFQAILQALEAVVRYSEAQGRLTSTALDELLLQVSLDVLRILTKALRQHHGNSRYFTKKIPGGGWKVLRHLSQRLSSRLCTSPPTQSHQNNLIRLSGAKGAPSEAVPLHSGPPLEATPHPEASPPEGLQSSVRQCFSQSHFILNPEAVTIISDLYTQSSSVGKHAAGLPTIILTILDCIIEMSERNRVAVHESGALAILLPRLVNKNMNTDESALLRTICESLLPLGTRRLEETAQIFKLACEDDLVKTILLGALQASKQPPAIQFDLSNSGHGSVELAALPRAFPPAKGYTFSSWIRVDQFDAACHTTIFGAFDASQTCFVLIYI
jgi:hypothetical protein